MDNFIPKYRPTPQTPSLMWNEWSFFDARDNFERQLRYIIGLIDMLYSQKNITEKTAAILSASINELDRWSKEIEIALRKEMAKKGNKNEDN